MQRVIKSLLNVRLKIYLDKRRNHNFLPAFIRLSEEVQESVLNGSPVVALESTVITHGLPYPQNLSTAFRLEEIVRQNNAIPATIGIINGIIHVGMNSEQLEVLASKKEKSIKVSRRDLPYMISKRLTGGTTVAATMLIAHKAGIPVFATGGIGGVHRGAEKSMDISADLYELSQTPVTVISAGVKSILDIGLTLEYLESLGVCIATFGSSKEFPSFFTPNSGFSSPCNVETYTEAAHLIDCRDQLQLKSGLLLAVPIPEKYSNDGLQTDRVISEALRKAVENNIKGKDVTPYVLKQVHELSAGASLRANIGLLENNAEVCSCIACELSKLKNKNPTVSSFMSSSSAKQEPLNSVSSSPRPVIVGGSILDIHVKAAEDIQMDGRTVRGCVQSTAGGVGRNIADCLARLRTNPLLVSVVGAQEYHTTLLEKMQHMDRSGIQIVSDARTATCVVMLDRTGECQCIVGDMGVHDCLQPQQVENHRQSLATAPLVITDCNVPFETMEYVLDICSEHQVPVWLEPTDISIAARMFQRGSKWRSSLSYASPNLNELKVMYSAILDQHPPTLAGSGLKDLLAYTGYLAKPLLTGNFHTLLVTLGSHGVALVTTLDSECLFPIQGSEISKGEVRIVHYSAPNVRDIISVSGAGDCFAAGMITGILQRLSPSNCIEAAKRAAALSLKSHLAVPDTMCPEEVLPS